MPALTMWSYLHILVRTRLQFEPRVPEYEDSGKMSSKPAWSHQELHQNMDVLASKHQHLPHEEGDVGCRAQPHSWSLGQHALVQMSLRRSSTVWHSSRNYKAHADSQNHLGWVTRAYTRVHAHKHTPLLHDMNSARRKKSVWCNLLWSCKDLREKHAFP